ncbi:hypothetical protein [Sedimenticola hydrogenitrophicus]|uniref:hypothetical protein n=1 Tax=Sedimenticola hydrogenitrophicus TaxID=2967975 RepID=UPI002FFC9C4B
MLTKDPVVFMLNVDVMVDDKPQLLARFAQAGTTSTPWRSNCNRRAHRPSSNRGNSC